MMDQLYHWVGVAVVWGNIIVLAILLGLTLLGQRWYVWRWRLGQYWRRNAVATPSTDQPLKRPFGHYWRRQARRPQRARPPRSTGA